MNPIDLNKVSREQLSSVYILSEKQLNSFFSYRQKAGNLLSIYELQAIPDFDLGASLFIVNRFMVGVNYRLGSSLNAKYGSTSIALLLQAKVTPKLRIGYAFEHNFTRLNLGKILTSHDLMIGYEFNTSTKRILSPRFVSFF